MCILTSVPKVSLLFLPACHLCPGPGLLHTREAELAGAGNASKQTFQGVRGRSGSLCKQGNSADPGSGSTSADRDKLCSAQVTPVPPSAGSSAACLLAALREGCPAAPTPPCLHHGRILKGWLCALSVCGSSRAVRGRVICFRI